MSLSSSTRTRRSIQSLLVLALVAFGAIIVGCGGSDDSSGDGSGGGTINLVAYSTPQQAYEEHLEPAFTETANGSGVEFTNSFGASGDQSRAVEAGQSADYVNFALETDITRLVDSGQVSPDWNKNKYKGIVTNSVVAIVVRPGNPLGIKNFEDIVNNDDIEVVTPNPFTSGGARWNIMAVYGSALNSGKTPDQALEDVKNVLSKTPTQSESARVALQAFLGGTGDVLLSYENEAIAAQLAGEDVEYVVPESTILIEQPAAVIEGASQTATDFLDWNWTDEAQQIWQEQGYRSVNPKLLDKEKFPVPAGLFTIAEFGGWDKVADEFFGDGTGSIFKIVQELGYSTE